MSDSDVAVEVLDHQNSEFYKSLLDDMITFVAVLDPDGNIQFVNNTSLKLAGITLEEVEGTKLWNAYWWSYSDNAIESIRADVAICAAGENVIHEIQVLTEDGSLIWIEYSMHPIFNDNGTVDFLVPEGRDVTDRKKQEEILRRSMKMDALGKLTAGIAHDYNNILGIISGYTELISLRSKQDQKMSKYVNDIQSAADRGASLARKLLSFTRQKISEPSICSINHKLDELQLMLETTLTSKVALIYHLEKNIWSVELDEYDLEDSIINICINAMHAMESGGQLAIYTENVIVDEVDGKPLGITAGEYVQLSFADTGCGMDKETVDKIFDPFFTTKGDQGTGLGMSQVHGFLQRTGGAIRVFSQLDLGTRVALYFPAIKQPTSPLLVADNEQPNLSGSESILVVDDERAMADLACEILQRKGYYVTPAYNAVQALYNLEASKFDLVITDVVMPNMNGYELATEVIKRHPKVKIQIVSGFEDDRYITRSHPKLRENIIYKPYTSNRLLTQVRKLFDDENFGRKTGLNILLMDDDVDYCHLFEIRLSQMGHRSVTTHNSTEAVASFEATLNGADEFDIIILDLNISNDVGGVEVAQQLRQRKQDQIIIVSSGNTECVEMCRFSDFGFDASLDKNCYGDALKNFFESMLPIH